MNTYNAAPAARSQVTIACDITYVPKGVQAPYGGLGGFSLGEIFSGWAFLLPSVITGLVFYNFLVLSAFFVITDVILLFIILIEACDVLNAT